MTVREKPDKNCVDGPERSSVAKDGRVQLVPRVVILGIFAALSIELISWESVGAPFEAAPGSERLFYDPGGGNHLFGILICGWMLWRRGGAFERIRDPSAHSTLLTGIACAALLASTVLRGWAAYVDATQLQLPAIALFLLGGATLVAGVRGARAAVLPALALVLSSPIPAPIVNSVLHPMQIMTAEGVAGLLTLLGVEHRLYGEQIHTTAYVFYVIEGCAGLRTLQTFALALCVYVESLYRNRMQVLVLIAVWPVAAIGVNQLRVLMIALAPESGLAEDHTIQGVLMIALGIPAIAVLDAWIERNSSAGAPGPPDRCEEATDPMRSPRRRVVAAVVLCGLQLALSFGISARPALKLDTPRAAELPLRFGEFTAYRTIELDSLYMGSVRGSDHVYRRLRHDSADALPEQLSDDRSDFELLILVDDHRDRSLDVISRKSALANPGWSVVEERSIEIDGVPATYLELRGPGGREEVIHWYLGRPAEFTRWARALFAIDTAGASRPILSVRVSALRDEGAAKAVPEDLQILARNVLAEVRKLGLARDTDSEDR